MRDRLLAVAEVCGWIASSFTAFLVLRVASIFLNLFNPAQCTDSCGAGADGLAIALFSFGLSWFPFVLVAFVRIARHGPERWWIPHAVVVTVAHAGAMTLLIGIFGRYSDADTRTAILAFAAGTFDIITLLVLLVGVSVKRRNL